MRCLHAYAHSPSRCTLKLLLLLLLSFCIQLIQHTPPDNLKTCTICGLGARSGHALKSSPRLLYTTPHNTAVCTCFKALWYKKGVGQADGSVVVQMHFFPGSHAVCVYMCMCIHTCIYIYIHVLMSHVTRINESCHTNERVMSHYSGFHLVRVYMYICIHLCTYIHVYTYMCIHPNRFPILLPLRVRDFWSSLLRAPARLRSHMSKLCISFSIAHIVLCTSQCGNTRCV